MEVEVTQVVTIDIEKMADALEDWFMDEEISNSDCSTFGELKDIDYERVLVAVCETIIKRYQN